MENPTKEELETIQLQLEVLEQWARLEEAEVHDHDNMGYHDHAMVAEPAYAWRALVRRGKPLCVMRVDRRKDATISAVEKLSQAMLGERIRLEIPKAHLEEIVSQLPPQEAADIYAFVAAADSVAASRSRGTRAEVKSTRLGTFQFQQVVGPQVLMDRGRGYGATTPLVPTASGDRVYCDLLLAEAQSDADTIAQDYAIWKTAHDSAEQHYAAAQADYDKGEYANCLQEIGAARALAEFADNAATDGMGAWYDLNDILSGWAGTHCDVAPFMKILQSASANVVPFEKYDVLLDQLTALERQAKDRVKNTNDMLATKNVADCMGPSYKVQWYGGDFVLDETCTTAFVDWLNNGIDSNWGNVVSGFIGLLANAIPYAGGELSALVAILAIDAALIPVVIKKEDKGNGITIHLSLIGWAVSDLGGVSTTLLIQAATGVGEVFGEALGTGMWITGN
jgi:hypothetical protein